VSERRRVFVKANLSPKILKLKCRKTKKTSKITKNIKKLEQNKDFKTENRKIHNKKVNLVKKLKKIT